MTRFARWLGYALAVAAVAAVVIAGLVTWELSSASLKPRIIQAAERATGRTMTIAGDVGIKLSLKPTIWLEDVTLSNPPGLSRPEMVKVARVELTVGLIPLLRHRVEVDRIALSRPDILLETEPAGQPNWVFSRPPPQVAANAAPPANAGPPGSSTGQGATGQGAHPGPEAPPGPATSPATSPEQAPLARKTPKLGFIAALKDVVIEDGRVGWVDPRSGQLFSATLRRVEITAPDTGPAQIAGTIMYNGRTIGLAARTGPLRDLATASDARPWPVAVKAQSHGVTILVEGTVAHPPRGRGYSFSVDVEAPDPPSLVSWLPGLEPHSLKGVTARARVSDGGGRGPVISALEVKVGSVDLDNLMHGARLDDVRVSGAGEGPLKVSARLTMAGAESGIGGTAGDLAWLTGGGSGPVAVDLAWNAASARGTVVGMIRQPRRLADYALEVAVNAPNPAMVLDAVPAALRSVSFQTTLTDAPGPVAFQFDSNAGDLEGELAISRSPRLSVVGTIASRRLDLDMLRAPPAAEAPAATGSGQVGSGQVGSGQIGSGQIGSGQAAPPAKGEPLIPATPLPLDRIRAIDADLKFNLGRVHLGGADIAGIEAVLKVAGGVLRLDPVVVASPDQHLNAALTVDAAATPPRVHLTVDRPPVAPAAAQTVAPAAAQTVAPAAGQTDAPAAASGLPLGTLLFGLGLPPLATGTAELRADLTATGDTPRALAASLDGWAGVAVEGGQLDAGLANSWLDELRPLHIDGAGATALKCFALRADARSGVVTIQPLALNTAALIVEASGDVDLAHETLALRVRPRTKIGGTGIALPVRVSGPLRTPSARIDISAKGFGGGALAGLLLGGKDVMGAAGGGDPCADALARARQGAPAADDKP